MIVGSELSSTKYLKEYLKTNNNKINCFANDSSKSLLLKKLLKNTCLIMQNNLISVEQRSWFFKICKFCAIYLVKSAAIN